jgi:putative ABC transport system permease protein
MTLVAFIGAVELGIIFALLAMGIFVAYRILGIPDLTIEGSFTIGAAVSAVFITNGQAALGLPVAMAAGAAAGIFTAFLQTKLKIQPILAGILTMTALYSVNLYVMSGRANIALLREETLFTLLAGLTGHTRLWQMLLPIIVTVLTGAVLGVFFHTRLGLSVRATGDNEEMVRASSINSTFTKAVGLAIANLIAALCGALIAQYQGFADINMGGGMVIVALASLIIGEAVFGRRAVIWNICAVAAGAVIYRIILAFALSFRINPANLRAISAIIVIAAISYPAIKERFAVYRLRRRAAR